MNAAKSFGSLSPRHHHRNVRDPISCFRRRRRRLPGTPLSCWKFDERHRPDRYGLGFGSTVKVSARKLAAALWQLRLLSQASHRRFKCESCHRFSFQPSNRGCGVGIKDLPKSPLLCSSSSYKFHQKHESSLPFPNLVIEGLTERDPGCSKTTSKTYCLYNHLTRLDDKVLTFSVVSALQTELLEAQLRINELEDQHRSSRKNYEDLIRKLREERNSWFIRKHQKMQAVVDELNHEIIKQRKRAKHIEYLNSKFVNELAKAESLSKRFLQDYEEEKRARELLEEVCNELAEEIGKGKAQLEMLKNETMRIHGEMEEERNMLQLAEIWREEHMQMKLVDAKLALEHKYSKMNKLVEVLDSILRSSSGTLDVMAFRKTDLLRLVVESVNIQDNGEFQYMSPQSSSILSISEEHQQGVDGREMERLTNSSPICDVSSHHVASPWVKFASNHLLEHSNGLIDRSKGSKKESRSWDWDCSRYSVDQGSRDSAKGSDCSSHSVNGGKVGSKSIMVHNGSNGGPHYSKTDTTNMCSVAVEQQRQKACSVSQLRSSNVSGGRVPSGSISHVYGGCRRRDLTGLGNPHITRGMRGSVEWPRVTRKTDLKDKLLKAMMESHKTHLRKVLE